ncbi:MAG: Rrf2 family transcriptional regulator [Candidatus Latescibacteria bacterium]|jgi:Rrf2 family protein|nr:Rrf2 family transcriptional regulator [Candidatus Latescibacterota bacterium]
MIFSQTSKYAIRALVHLAHYESTPRLSPEIAEELDIPKCFLAKILQDLVRRNLLQSFKGRGGGFKLARAPDRITLLEIVQAVEGPEFGQHCLLGLSECGDHNPCPLHDQWTLHGNQFLNMLQSQTLGQLTVPNDRV